MIKLKKYLNRPTYAVDKPWTEGTFSFGSEYTHNRYKFNTAKSKYKGKGAATEEIKRL